MKDEGKAESVYDVTGWGNISVLGYGTGTHVAGMLSFLRNVEALKYVLTNAPLGSKQQAAKEDKIFCCCWQNLILLFLPAIIYWMLGTFNCKI
jgi:hypothetical protein